MQSTPDSFCLETCIAGKIKRMHGTMNNLELKRDAVEKLDRSLGFPVSAGPWKEFEPSDNIEIIIKTSKGSYTIDEPNQS